jgi:starch-binding outer membrane protein, SusD/RagB family
MTLRRIVLLAGVLGMGACSFDLSTNPNSPDPIGEDPSRGQVQAAATGMLIALREDIQDFALDVGIQGREALRIDGSDPRFISELLIGPTLDDGGDAFGGDHWLEEYSSIREGNRILTVLPTATLLTAEEVSATSGYVKTIQALAFVLVLDTHIQDSIPIDIPLDITAPPAPFVTNAAAWDHVITLLEEGNTELAAGGAAFPFTLPAGFTGFDTPASFATFNRALRARVAAYREDWAGVLTALTGSFLNTAASLQLGVYMNYGTGPGDFPNPLVPSTVENFAHVSLLSLAQPPGDGVTKDLRLTTKTATRGSLSSNGFSSDLGFIRYPLPSSTVPIIKNEELILLRAEANINLNDLTTALTDINLVRTTSGGLEALTTLGTQDQAIDELLYNRLFSLLFEGGHRWIDLRRYGRLAFAPDGGIPRSRDPNASAGGGPEVIYQTLPIPRDEVLAR